MKYAIGMDNGGTNSKAALIDETGCEIAVSKRTTPLIIPRPGYIERDMELLWELNCECIREVIEKSGVNPVDIVGIAVAGHGKGLYAWGKDNKPAYNGIVSTDNRAWEYPMRWQQEDIFKSFYPRLCQRLLSGQQAAILAWLKDYEPTVYENIQWIFSVKDYIRFRLTGEAFGELTDMSGSGVMDITRRQYDQNLLADLGITEVHEKLPELRYSHERCGNITPDAAEKTGLLPGTSVMGGMFDIDACALAMDVTGPDSLFTITGTWSINGYISKEPVMDGGDEVVMNSLYAIPGYYLIEECSPTGAGNLEWNLELLANQKTYQDVNEWVTSVPPEDSEVYYLPFLYGSNAHPLGKAAYVGLTSYHTRDHMLRAVYESAAFTAKTHIDRLLAYHPSPKAIRIAGGVTSSPMWVQMFADILGYPVETVSGLQELGAFGCAMAVFVAAGVYEDYLAAAKGMVHVSAPVQPDKTRVQIYEQKYQKYQAVRHALDEVWPVFEV